MKLSDEVREMVEHEQNEIDGPCGPGYRGKCWGEAIENVRARLIEAVDEGALHFDKVNIELVTARLAVFTALFGSGQT